MVFSFGSPFVGEGAAEAEEEALEAGVFGGEF